MYTTYTSILISETCPNFHEDVRLFRQVRLYRKTILVYIDSFIRENKRMSKNYAHNIYYGDNFEPLQN